MDARNTNEEAKQIEINEAPQHLQGMQVIAEGYQYYMNYLKDGGDDGMSELLGDLQIVGF